MKLWSMVSIAFVSLVVTAQAEPVVSVDTNRIISLACNAICKTRDNVQPATLKFSRITYSCSERQRNLQVIFHHSPIAETTPKSDVDRDGAHAKNRFTEAIVWMDENGEVQAVTDNEREMQLINEAERRQESGPVLQPGRELPLAQGASNPVKITGQVWAYDARDRIAELISRFAEAVNKTDVDALQSLVHPAIRHAMSDEQRLVFRELYLRACFQHHYEADRVLHYKPMGKGSLRTLREEWPGRWLVDPEIEIVIENKKASAGRGKKIPVYVATSTRDVWCLVFPIPGKQVVEAYLRQAREQKND